MDDYSDEEEEVMSDNEIVESYCDDPEIKPQSKPYNHITALKESDIHQRIQELQTLVSDVLCVSKIEASLILRYYNWTVTHVHDAWFLHHDHSIVRQKVGLLLTTTNHHQLTDSTHTDTTTTTCGICFDAFNAESLSFTRYCEHSFCNQCFSSYIDTSINDGPGCLKLKCPQFSCDAAVDQDLIDKLASKDNRDKYSRYLVSSYVEGNKNTKWCPAPGCDFALQFELGGVGGTDVSCVCSHSFCWICAGDAHRPVGCDSVRKWVALNKSEGFTMDWILVNTRPCPKCKQPIEKNGGCMRMTCKPPCGYQFCWLCRQDWSVHGYAACNSYEKEKVDQTAEMKLTSNNLQRYAHYYQRWAANDASFKKAHMDLKLVKDMKIEELCESQCQPNDRLKFILEAWKQITECRRVLKWSYVYGYYLAEDNIAKKQLFEYSQGEAESALERLHECAEEEVKEFYKSNTCPSPNLDNYRVKLTHLTNVTKNFFENLVTALENGLSDVESSQSTRGIKKRRTCSILDIL
ncbi:hypothetical protein ACFE04_011574 [Oxalis oulophora]